MFERVAYACELAELEKTIRRPTNTHFSEVFLVQETRFFSDNSYPRS